MKAILVALIVVAVLSFGVVLIHTRSICLHHWVSGPFWISASKTYEEPTYYPPGALMPVEQCSRCGLLRLPESTWKTAGKGYLDAQ